MENSKEMNRFIDIYELLKLKQKDAMVLNNPIAVPKTEGGNKNCQLLKAQVLMHSQPNYTENLEN